MRAGALVRSVVVAAAAAHAASPPPRSSAAQWFAALPPVTRTLLATYLASGLGILLGAFPTHLAYHDWGLELRRGQLWRLATNFAVIGKPSINYLFQLVWLVRYGAAYESAKFLGDAAGAATCALVGAAAILALDGLAPALFSGAFHGASLIFMLLYLWSRANPTQVVGFFGVVQFQAFYLPFALLALDVVQGASPAPGVRGILAGHLYYFLADVYPRASGRRLIATPRWLASAVARVAPAAAPPAAARAAAGPNPSDARFRAFSGAGRRLAD